MKTYLHSLALPTTEDEHMWLYLNDGSHKALLNDVYSSLYPFGLFTKFKHQPLFEFDPITIIYGGNGSGKSTLLNVIAKKLKLDRKSPNAETDFFGDYCRLCGFDFDAIPKQSKFISSDDVFNRLFNTRSLNEIINTDRNELWKRKSKMISEICADSSKLKLSGMDDYDRFKEYYDALNSSTSKFIKNRAHKNLDSKSNGETALEYLTSEIGENALYLLDEPENSLSPSFQLDLKTFIEESARFFDCQFIISTHSPLLLATEGAKIYSLDDGVVRTHKWYELENVKTYAKFFAEHSDKF